MLEAPYFKYIPLEKVHNYLSFKIIFLIRPIWLPILYRNGVPSRNTCDILASTSWKAFNSFDFVYHLWLIIAWDNNNWKVSRCTYFFYLFVIWNDVLFLHFCRDVFYNDWPLMVLNIIGRGSSTGTLALCYVYSAEIFPTVVRNVGIGSSSVWVRT